MGTVTIIEVRYTEDEAAYHDEHGTVAGYEPPYGDDHTTRTIYDELSAVDAVRLIERHGLTFEASGNEWAADPDGSYVSNYGTGERCETSAHGSDWHPRVWAAITDKVG